MPVYIKTVNLTNANEGYQLSSLLSGILPSNHNVQYLRLEATAGWLVPASGAYSQTAGTPDDHGGAILSSGLIMNPGSAIVDLDEIFVGSGVANHKIRVLAIR